MHIHSLKKNQIKVKLPVSRHPEVLPSPLLTIFTFNSCVTDASSFITLIYFNSHPSNVMNSAHPNTLSLHLLLQLTLLLVLCMFILINVQYYSYPSISGSAILTLDQLDSHMVKWENQPTNISTPSPPSLLILFYVPLFYIAMFCNMYILPCKYIKGFFVPLL